jgi:hypothetical protein
MQARAAGRWQAQVGVGGQSCVVGSRRAELRQPECLDAKPTMGAGCLGAGLIGHPAGLFMLAKEEARASPAGAPCCHTSKDHLLMSSSTLTWRMVPWRLDSKKKEKKKKKGQSNGSCYPLGSLHLCSADAFSSALPSMI